MNAGPCVWQRLDAGFPNPMTRAKPRNMLANCIYSRNRLMGSCARNFSWSSSTRTDTNVLPRRSLQHRRGFFPHRSPMPINGSGISLIA